MKLPQTNVYGSATLGLAELNHYYRTSDQNERRSRTARQVHDLSDENGQGITEEEQEDNQLNNLVHDQDMQKSQLQIQGPVIHWNKFLPTNSLKVLLVESDRSTRQIISALLKNCSYDVTAVEDGLQAWKVMVDLSNHVDIVLTEVVMPYLSGMGLLRKIRNHKTFNNIPVIMMSGHNSIRLALKCLSRGAVNFLVKPIRKNELKTIWQHVWRKCHISGSNGSETGSTVKSFAVEEYDDNPDNYNEVNGTTGRSLRVKCHYRSGTKASENRKVKFDSFPTIQPIDKSCDTAEKNVTQLICLIPETLSDKTHPMAATRDYRNQDDENFVMGKDLTMRVLGHPVSQLEKPNDQRLNEERSSEEGLRKRNLKNSDMKFGRGNLELKSGMPSDEPKNQVVVIEIPDDASHVSKTRENNHGCAGMSFLELSLKLPRSDGDNKANARDHNGLRHSDFSAFARYNSVSSVNQAPNGNAESCSPVNESSKTDNFESTDKFGSNSSGTCLKQLSNGSINATDMDSATCSAPETLDGKPPSKSTAHDQHASPFFQLMRDNYITPSPLLSPGRSKNAAVETLINTMGRNQEAQVQHHHHHYYHHHLHVHQKVPQEQKVSRQGNSPLQIAETLSIQANLERGKLYPSIKDSTGYHSLNGSSSGSNHGSNGQSHIIGLNGEAGSMSRVDHNRVMQRMAALNRFRQKRKERCFEKKVRYQSRKRLAEQRPRIRGQFVRQAIEDNKNKEQENN